MRVLSIDDGGTASLVALSVLVQLDSVLQSIDKSVASLFDLFFGSGFGALIICAVVYGGISPQDLLARLWQLMRPFLFCRRHGPLRPPHCAKFYGSLKRKLVERLIPARARFFDTNPHQHVVITLYNFDLRKPVVYCSWQVERRNVLVRDLVDASLSYPTEHPLSVMTSAGLYERCYGGGFMTPNPTLWGLIEFDAYARNQSSRSPPSLRVLSLGCGKLVARVHPEDEVPDEVEQDLSSDEVDIGLAQWATQSLLGIQGDAQREVAHQMSSKFCSTLNHNYLRVNDEVAEMKRDLVGILDLEGYRDRGNDLYRVVERDIWMHIMHSTPSLLAARSLFQTHFNGLESLSAAATAVSSDLNRPDDSSAGASENVQVERAVGSQGFVLHLPQNYRSSRLSTLAREVPMSEDNDEDEDDSSTDEFDEEPTEEEGSTGGRGSLQRAPRTPPDSVGVNSPRLRAPPATPYSEDSDEQDDDSMLA